MYSALVSGRSPPILSLLAACRSKCSCRNSCQAKAVLRTGDAHFAASANGSEMMLTVNCFVALILLHVSLRPLSRGVARISLRWRDRKPNRCIRHGERHEYQRRIMACSSKIREWRQIRYAILVKGRAEADRPRCDPSDHELVWDQKIIQQGFSACQIICSHMSPGTESAGSICLNSSRCPSCVRLLSNMS